MAIQICNDRQGKAFSKEEEEDDDPLTIEKGEKKTKIIIHARRVSRFRSIRYELCNIISER